MALSLDADAIAVVASHCDPSTMAILCRIAFRVREVVQPQLYRRVIVRSFKQASLFLTAIIKSPPHLVQLVNSYAETSDVRMPHLVTAEFAKTVVRSLKRMSNLEVLRLANSIKSLRDFNSAMLPALRQLRRLKDVELYDYPVDADEFACPGTSLSALLLNGADLRSNSCRIPSSEFVQRIIYQSCNDLQTLRLTTSSLIDVVSHCKGITWDRVHSLGLDTSIIPEEFTVVFPNVVNLEIWGTPPHENHIPDRGWPKLTRVEYVIQAVGGHDTGPARVYSRPRTVSTLVVRSGGSQFIHGIYSALACVDNEKLEHIRVGYVFHAGGQRFWSGCQHVYSIEMELRMTEAKDQSLLNGLALCAALQELTLVFREQEAMAEFENRYLQPDYDVSIEDDDRRIPARTAYGTAFARAVGGEEFGSRRVIPRPDLLRRIVLSLRSGWCEEYLEIMHRLWTFEDETLSWILTRYV